MIKESWQISDELLYFLFASAKNNEKPWLKHSNLRLSPVSKQSGFEGLLLQGLIKKKYVDVRRDEDSPLRSASWTAIATGRKEQRQEYQISLNGLDYVIGELEDKESHISKIAEGSVESSVESFPKVIRGISLPLSRDSKAQSEEDGNRTAPASDRVVLLNHNEPEYLNVKKEIENAKNAISSINIAAENEVARDNIVAELNAAEALWNCAELTLMQIKIGILLAAENAAKFAKETAQSVKVALLVDAIKAFITNKIGQGFF
jgi:hypothetical protein